jgi:hypothetical protein
LQGNDPATDFRGMGLLGLTTILYFARHHADTLSALLKHGRSVVLSPPPTSPSVSPLGVRVSRFFLSYRSYPWASTGINLTQMLFKSLKLDGTYSLDNNTINNSK